MPMSGGSAVRSIGWVARRFPDCFGYVRIFAWPELASWRHLVAFHGTIDAMRVIEARYEEGLLKPETPLALTPGERVALIVVRHPDPRRWDLERLSKSGAREDQALAEQALAEQGLAEWADVLDREDHSSDGARCGRQTSATSDRVNRPVVALW